jgi:hypothetical protein
MNFSLEEILKMRELGYCLRGATRRPGSVSGKIGGVFFNCAKVAQTGLEKKPDGIFFARKRQFSDTLFVVCPAGACAFRVFAGTEFRRTTARVAWTDFFKMTNERMPQRKKRQNPILPQSDQSKHNRINRINRYTCVILLTWYFPDRPPVCHPQIPPPAPKQIHPDSWLRPETCRPSQYWGR